MALTQTGNYREKMDTLLGQHILHNARSVSCSQSNNHYGGTL
jgi:hypothetical protein